VLFGVGLGGVFWGVGVGVGGGGVFVVGCCFVVGGGGGGFFVGGGGGGGGGSWCGGGLLGKGGVGGESGAAFRRIQGPQKRRAHKLYEPEKTCERTRKKRKGKKKSGSRNIYWG